MSNLSNLILTAMQSAIDAQYSLIQATDRADSTSATLANAIKPELALADTFEKWETIRKAFVAEAVKKYSAKGANKDSAQLNADAFWGRIVEKTGLAKPAATTAEATRKQESRKAEKSLTEKARELAEKTPLANLLKMAESPETAPTDKAVILKAASIAVTHEAQARTKSETLKAKEAKARVVDAVKALPSTYTEAGHTASVCAAMLLAAENSSAVGAVIQHKAVIEAAQIKLGHKVGGKLVPASVSDVLAAALALLNAGKGSGQIAQAMQAASAKRKPAK